MVKQTALSKKLSNLTLASAILPVVVTFVSGCAYIITQQVLTLFTGLVDIVPPYLMTTKKNRMVQQLLRIMLQFIKSPR